MTPDLNQKIAILGAGPSGLAAAEALREKGYRHIVVFERANRIGGQALSAEYTTPDGRKIVYDLGTVQPTSSKNLSVLYKRYGIHLGRGLLQDKSKVIFAYSYIHQREFANFLKHSLGAPLRLLPIMLADMAKLSWYLWRYRRLAKPGFHGFRYWDETAVGVGTWMAERRFKYIGERLTAMLVSALTLNNASQENEVGVYQIFKSLYAVMRFPMRYVDGSYRPVREGIQELWKRVAANFEVVFNADISRIHRTAEGIELTLPDGAHHFDALILACNVDKIMPLMNSSPAELQAFQHVRYHPGYRAAFVAKGGPVDGVHWYPDSYTDSAKHSDTVSYLTFAIPEAMVSPGVYLYTCMFSICPTGADAVRTLQSSAERMFRDQHDAEIVEWVKMQYWPHFAPGFDLDTARSGVFDRIHALQGHSRTYYTGHLLSLAGNANTADFSYDLVDHFF